MNYLISGLVGLEGLELRTHWRLHAHSALDEILAQYQ
jgi:hypothetical protein